MVTLTTNLRLGSAGEAVRAAKERLFLLGLYEPQVPDVTHDRFGRDTLIAVLRFQRENGLTADGVIGPLTWERLFPNEQAQAESTGNAAAEERGGIPQNIGDAAAEAILAALAGATDLRKHMVTDALSFAFDPRVPRQYPLSLYIRGANLYNVDLSPYVISIKRIDAGQSRQPQYYDNGRAEMMRAAVENDSQTTGADCSGGVAGLLRHAGAVKPTFDLSANGFCGKAHAKQIEKSALRPADLVHKSGHIGLYVGGGYVVEWMGGAYGCQLTKLDARAGFSFVSGKQVRQGAWTAFLRPSYYR